MRVSIIIPVFNEEKTIKKLVEKVLSVVIPGIEKEIIIVDDGSTDNTSNLIKKSINKQIVFLQHKTNKGKGAAVQTGITKAKGEYIIIQDADLEYDPVFLPQLITPVMQKKGIVVYGSRLTRFSDIAKQSSFRFKLHFFGNRFLSFITSILYKKWLTDIETGYKVLPKKSIEQISLTAKGFDIEVELTTKLLKKKYIIVEVPITTTPRGYQEGKKLRTVHDGVIALWKIIKFRFID